MLTELNDVVELNDYIEKCKGSIEYHTGQAKNSLDYHNLLNVFCNVIGAAQILTISFLAITASCNDVKIAIASASFASTILVLGRVQASYNFNVLNVLHNQVSDDFNELKQKLESRRNNTHDENLDALKIRYLSVVEKSHLQHVNSCFLLKFF